MTRNLETTSRTATTREASKRKSMVFEEPNWLAIPETVKERFLNNGMSLRWIRVLVNNNEDYQNVGKRLAEGWEFVNSEEVPEMLHSSFVRDTGRYQGSVCRGDLALAKMPTELAVSRQEFYENRSRDMVAAVNAQLMNSSDSRMPIQNQSKTQVSRGKIPKFQD